MTGMTDGLRQRQAFIGVGTMGSLMASCLLEAGVELTVYDRRRAAAAPLLSKGARWADTAAAAASGCGMAWVSLPGPAEVEAVLLEYGAPVIAALPAGAILVDTTTNDPEVSRRVAAAGEQRGVAVLDAPVSGRPPTMTLMAGGDRADFHRARPWLEAVAAQVFYVGPSGAGGVAKLATQYMGYTNLIAAIEGMLIAQMGGVDPATLAEIVPVSAGAQPGFWQHPQRHPAAHFCGGRHAGHCGQGYGAGVPAGGTAGCAGQYGADCQPGVRKGAGDWAGQPGLSGSGAGAGNYGAGGTGRQRIMKAII